MSELMSENCLGFVIHFPPFFSSMLFPTQQSYDSPKKIVKQFMDPSSPSSTTVPPSDREITIKIVVVGRGNVGKTSLLAQYVKNQFNMSYKATIGADFFQKVLIPRESYDYFRMKYNQEASPDSNVPHVTLLRLWDISGQENSIQMCRLFTSGSHAAFVVADATAADSFQKAADWRRKIRETCFIPRAPQEDCNTIPCILLVNKYDLVQDKPASAAAFSTAEIHAFSKTNGFDSWKYVSAKTKYNVAEVISETTQRIYTDPRLRAALELEDTSQSGDTVQRSRQNILTMNARKKKILPCC